MSSECDWRNRRHCETCECFAPAVKRFEREPECSVDCSHPNYTHAELGRLLGR